MDASADRGNEKALVRTTAENHHKGVSFPKGKRKTKRGGPLVPERSPPSGRGTNHSIPGDRFGGVGSKPSSVGPVMVSTRGRKADATRPLERHRATQPSAG
jgi:hypothetical protein